MQAMFLKVNTLHTLNNMCLLPVNIIHNVEASEQVLNIARIYFSIVSLDCIIYYASLII